MNANEGSSKDHHDELIALDALEKRTLKTHIPHSKPKSLKFMSYNMWIDGKRIEDRTKSIARLILHHMPDIVCLQEVRPDMYPVLSELLTDRYHIFQGFEDRPIGIVLMVNRRIKYKDNYFYDFPETEEYGQVIGCTLIFPGVKRLIHVLGTQFDSDNTREEMRCAQFEALKQIIKTQNCSNVVVLVDTSITRGLDHASPELLETKLSEYNLLDCWTQIHCPSNCKYTIDHYNHNIKSMLKSRNERVHLRPDRILYRFRHGARPIRMDLIGKHNSPSTHYGLMTTLTPGK